MSYEMKVLCWESKRSDAYIKLKISNGLIEFDSNLWGPRYLYAIKESTGYALFLDYTEPFYMYLVKVVFKENKIDVVEIKESYENLKTIFEMFKGEKNAFKVEKGTKRGL